MTISRKSPRPQFGAAVEQKQPTGAINPGEDTNVGKIPYELAAIEPAESAAHPLRHQKHRIILGLD